MRKLLSITLLLPIVMGCGKKTMEGATDYSATFTRTVNSANPWTWAFNSKTWCTLTFTQTFYTGSTTTGKQTRWTVLLSDPTDKGSLNLTFPGTDSSATLPTGKDLTFTSRITQPDPMAVTCSLIDKGAYYSGGDSAFVHLTLESFNKKTITATFSALLYNQGAIVAISNGHLTNIPVTLVTP